ncbi:het domain protein [Diplodia corticola]|uniref:Het domain protein n=1 Tax=Diplodia corticola TaxID=236234 RepID=A0A1J9S067_9PEZI|nr:het domain protein [Diplodia corticola]OJD33077.1 het domain protein [Diplodia corticola]
MDHIRGIDDYKVRLFSSSYDDWKEAGKEPCGFLNYPKRKNWTVTEDGSCVPPGPDDPSFHESHRMESFLQSWLFFGLIQAVLGYSNRINFEIFKGSGAIEESVTTSHLPRLLNNWDDFERQEDNKRDQSVRMVRIQMALDRARGVVKRYCSVEEEGVQGSRRNDELIDDNLALSLIVLGETLSYAKARIVERAGFTIRGWHGETSAGWGTSKAVVDRMKMSWCPRTVAILTRQLRGNTTALLEAHKLYPQLGEPKHHKCSREQCKWTSFANGEAYERRHTDSCPCKASGCDDRCLDAGPDLKKLLDIIREDKIPVFTLASKEQGGPLLVNVKKATEVSEYATISHVWSDGYGNPDSNSLCQCQVDFLQKALAGAQEKRGQKGKPIAFWMDTLAIPVGDSKGAKEMKSKCIRRIHETFVQSKYTVILDGGLMQTGIVGDDYSATAVKILASGWMRRLWTLQEAYLSERLFFAFKDSSLDLEDLESHYHEASDNLVSDMPTAARNYFHNLLGTARRARVHGLSPKEGIDLISSVWKAANWRTTTYGEHEVVALVSLLNLNTDDSDHAQDINRDFGAGEKSPMVIERNMKQFWMLLEELYPGSIPAGMIFLPPPRLTERGFGWAPRTWMSGKQLEHPDPLLLSALTPPGILSMDHGLLVQFPGFLLHSTEQTSQKILLNIDKSLTFPTDSTLLEWYKYRKAQDDEKDYHFIQQPVTAQKDSRKYAIILPRERPGAVEEIGLLVEIEKRQPQRSFADSQETRVFHVSIKFRILIKRETASHQDGSLNKFYQDMHTRGKDPPVFGEVLGPSQKWYVDRKEDSRQAGPARGYPSGFEAQEHVERPSRAGAASAITNFLSTFSNSIGKKAEEQSDQSEELVPMPLSGGSRSRRVW